MSRSRRRKPVMPRIEALEERQLLRHGAVVPAAVEERIANLVHQRRAARAPLASLSIGRRGRSGEGASQHRSHQTVADFAPRTAGTLTILNTSTNLLQASANPTPTDTFTVSVSSAGWSPVSVALHVNGVAGNAAQPGDYALSLPASETARGYSLRLSGSASSPAGILTIPAHQTEAVIDVTPLRGGTSHPGGAVNLELDLDSARRARRPRLAYRLGSPWTATVGINEPASGSQGGGNTIVANQPPGGKAGGSTVASGQSASGTSGGTTGPVGRAQPAYTDYLSQDQPPSLAATEGVAFSGVVAKFDDSNLAAPASSFNVTIDWGDGGNGSGSVVEEGQTGVYDVSGSHTYNDEGTVNGLSVTVSGSATNTLTMTGSAMVSDAGISLTGGATYNNVPVGQALNQPLAELKDNNPSATPGDYTVTIDWGDGTTTTGSVAGKIVRGSHSYTSPGSYAVGVTVTDDGGQMATTNPGDTINVVSPPQTISPDVCPNGTIQNNTCRSGGSPGSLLTSPGGIDYGTGYVGNADPNDLQSNGFGITWGQDLGWSNAPGAGAGSNFGSGMIDAYLPSLQQGPSGGINVTNTPYNSISYYRDSSGHLHGVAFQSPSLTQPGGTTGDIYLTDDAGDVFDFWGLDSTVPAAKQGQFKSFTDPYGNVTQVTSYTASNQIAEVQRTGPALSDGTGGTVTESYLFSYLGSGDANAGLVWDVTMRRQVNGGAWTPVRQVTYTYYDGTNPANGDPGELEIAQVDDGQGNVIDSTYYRYYTFDDVVVNHQPGYVGGLKYMVLPDSYVRIAAQLGVSALQATDQQLSNYADTYYEYDSSGRVTTTATQGTSCSCSTGLGTFSYTYTNSANPADYNNWQTKTTEVLPDGNESIVYTNYAGEVILKAFYDITDPGNPLLDGKVFATDYRYDSQGRLIMTAQPSAVTIQDKPTLDAAESNPDIVGYNGSNSYAYLSPNSGVVNVTDYGTTPTATSTTPGDVVGFVKDDKVENGYAGSQIMLDSTQYISHSDINGRVVYETASSTVYRNTDGTGAETTSTSYAWYANTNRIQSMTVSLPVISSGENGPGTADATTAYYDTYGRPTWTVDGDGFINYTKYDNGTGAVRMTIQDVDARESSLYGTPPAGLSIPASGHLDLLTQYTVDGLGRTTEEVSPGGDVTYTVYDDPNHESRVYPGWNATTGRTTGPIIAYRHDQANSYYETLMMAPLPALSGSSGSYVPTGAEGISMVQTLSRTLLDNSDRPVEVDDYTSLGVSGYSTAPHITGGTVTYNKSFYGYDDNGVLDHLIDANGTITDSINDSQGNVISTYVGTNDSTTDGEEYSPSNAGPNSNMTLVSQNQYDNSGVGDGNLTQTTLYPDSSSADNRVTQYAYDWRDRLVAVKSGVQSSENTTTYRPIIYYDLDNLGEVTGVSQFDGDGIPLTNTKPSASLLRAYSVSVYDDQGRPYQVQQYDVNQANGALGGTLTRNFYYDHRGNQIAQSDPGGLWTKDQYDGAGRLVSESLTDGAGGPSWSAAASLASDHVLTQTLTSYDGDGNPILITTKDRFDSDSPATNTDVGPLGSITTGPLARVSYVANYYDAADRLTASVEVGTNSGAAYTRPGSAPSRSDTTLVTSYDYTLSSASTPNALSPFVTSVTDPRGIVTQYTNDMLGQVGEAKAAYDQTINNGKSTTSNNLETEYSYDGNGDVTSVTAWQPAPSGSGLSPQTTSYRYGVTTAAGSAVNSNDLLAAIDYPDPTSGDASNAVNLETYTRNALGDVVTATDPNGTKHTYGYDVLGRQTSDAVGTLGAGVDGSVMQHTTAYDAEGNPYLFTSLNGSGGTVNQIQDVYNGLGQLTGEYQAHNGQVTTGTPEVQYGYTEMAGGQNNSRPTSMTYPNGRVLNYVYNSGGTNSSGLDSGISRISSLQDGSGTYAGTTLEAYTYLGLDTIVQRDYAQPGVELSYIQQTSETNVNNDGGDKYTGLDRFGRVVDQNWVNTNSTSTPKASDVRLQYAYDRSGNVLYQNDLVNPVLSQLYHANGASANSAYDPVGRLTSFAQGALSASGSNGSQLDTVSSPTTSQSWQLDAHGNWTSVTTNGATTNRLFNQQDQTIYASGLPEPGYDRNGNTTSDNGQLFVYDAWDRPVTVTNGTQGDAPVASYSYDALGRRISESYAGTSTTNDLYYDSAGQVIEERQNGTAAANVHYQYVWSLAYVNAVVLRDTYSGGAQGARVYTLQDANYDTMALVDVAGNMLERYTYTPYGTVTVRDASGNAVAGNQSAYGWQYLFQGGKMDGATGWYGFGARDYIPAEGRWAERDPLGQASGDASAYRFDKSDPLFSLDPSGLAGSDNGPARFNPAKNGGQMEGNWETNPEFINGELLDPDNCEMLKEYIRQLLTSILNRFKRDRVQCDPGHQARTTEEVKTLIFLVAHYLEHCSGGIPATALGPDYRPSPGLPPLFGTTRIQRPSRQRIDQAFAFVTQQLRGRGPAVPAVSLPFPGTSPFYNPAGPGTLPPIMPPPWERCPAVPPWQQNAEPGMIFPQFPPPIVVEDAGGSYGGSGGGNGGRSRGGIRYRANAQPPSGPGSPLRRVPTR